MKFICQCGQVSESTSGNIDYRITQYSNDGDLVFAICEHGVVVIDKRETEPKEVCNTCESELPCCICPYDT